MDTTAAPPPAAPPQTRITTWPSGCAEVRIRDSDGVERHWALFDNLPTAIAEAQELGHPYTVDGVAAPPPAAPPRYDLAENIASGLFNVWDNQTSQTLFYGPRLAAEAFLASLVARPARVARPLSPFPELALMHTRLRPVALRINGYALFDSLGRRRRTRHALRPGTLRYLAARRAARRAAQRPGPARPGISEASIERLRTLLRESLAAPRCAECGVELGTISHYIDGRPACLSCYYSTSYRIRRNDHLRLRYAQPPIRFVRRGRARRHIYLQRLRRPAVSLERMQIRFLGRRRTMARECRALGMRHGGAGVWCDSQGVGVVAIPHDLLGVW